MKLFVNDLTVIDFSYLCPERGVVGESWIVDIVLDGALNEQSMVLDFGLVKKQIKAIIDDSVDHKLLIPAEHPYTQVSHDEDSAQYWVDFMRPQGSYHLSCPAEAFAFIDSDRVSIDSVLAYVHAAIRQQLPANVKGLELTLRPEAINGFYYHYTHGLKKHDGNCQRIAHGHRSQIQIYVDNIRTPALEQQWSKRWEDIYLSSEEDLVKPEQLSLSHLAESALGEHHICCAYDADQGRFEMILPRSDNETMPGDSTVERIAEYIAGQVAEQVRQKSPQAEIKVVAYEGVNKGAIGYA